MIISYEKHLNDFINREQSLQKILKNQEDTIKDLQQKLHEKTEHLILPLKMRYESEISLKNRELNDLKTKINELQIVYNDEKMRLSSAIETNHSTNTTLQRQLEAERESFQMKSKEYESSLKTQIEVLTEGNERLFEENEKLRENLINFTQERGDAEILFENYNDFQVLYKEKEANLLAQNLNYRNEIENLRKTLEDQVLLSQKEKKLLQKKINEMLLQIKSNEGDMKYEFEQFKTHLKDLNKETMKKNAELLEMKNSKDKIIAELIKEKEDLESQIHSQKEEFLNDLKKKDESFEKKFAILSKEMVLINEEKSNELEKFIREIEIFKNEKVLCEKNLEDAKNSMKNRENYLNSELARQKLALDKLIELGQQRENILQEDISNLHETMLNLQKAYENKENASEDKYQGKNCLETLEKIVLLIRKIEEKIGQNRSFDNHKITELARENKHNILSLAEKTKEIEKLKNELLEKKTKEKQLIINQHERLINNFKELNDRIPSLMNNLSQVFAEPLKNKEIAVSIPSSPFITKNNEIELIKYQEKIIKNEAELELAKKSLIMYINHVKELEEQLEMINSENQEKIFSEQEILEMRLENNKLKEENSYLLELNKKLEENIVTSLKKYEYKSLKDSEEKDKNSNGSNNLLANNSKVINSSSEMKANKTANKDKSNDFKRLCKQIMDAVQILQKNLNNSNNFESEAFNNARDTIKLYEKRISQYEKVMETDFSTINKRISLLEETLLDPYNISKKLFDELKQYSAILSNEINVFNSRNSHQQNIWKEIDTKLKKSPFLQEREKNLLYQNEQQTIAILRSETNSLYNLLEEEKEKHRQELENMSIKYDASTQILEQKTESLINELENEKKMKENLNTLLEEIKKSQNKELKKMRFDLTNLNKFLTEKQAKFNEEKKRLSQEIQKLENLLFQKEQNYKKVYETKLIKFVESIEEKTKIINFKNSQSIQDEAILRKIDEEKEKKFIIQIKSLKEEINNFKDLEKEKDQQFQQEKSIIMKMVENLQQALEKLNNEKIIIYDQITCLKEIIAEKDKILQAKEQQYAVEYYQKNAFS